MDNRILAPFRLPGGGGVDTSGTVYREAWSLLESSDPRSALALLEPALAEHPSDLGLLSLRAWAYFQGAQLQRAEADLRDLVESDPSDVWARFTLSRVLERQSRYAEGLTHARLAAVMSADPEHEAGVLRLERKLAESGLTSFDDLR